MVPVPGEGCLLKRTLLTALIVTALAATPILGIAKPPKSRKSAGNPVQSSKIVHRFGKRVSQKIVAYRVQKGDTDEKIARRMGLSVRALRHFNDGKKLAVIREGQQLNVAKFAPAPPPKARVARSETPRRKVRVARAERPVVKIVAKAAPRNSRRAWVAKADPKPRLAPEAPALPVATPVEAPALVASVAATPSETPVETAPETPKRTGKGSVDGILEKANSFRGVRYRWGAASRSATDCSGFTSQVFRANGYSIPRTSAEQSKIGQRVGRDELQAGDLVFFQTIRGTRVSHVGIYVGDGRFIHASSGGHRVMVSSLSDAYYANHYVTARRVAKGGVVRKVVQTAKKAEETQQVPLDPEPKQSATDVVGN